jgi:hypothetical protein
VECTRDITDIKSLEAQPMQTYKMEAIGIPAGGLTSIFHWRRPLLSARLQHYTGSG